jgi:acyl-CoA synthetase (NDP forming)
MAQTAFDRWAAGHGPIRHSPATRTRVRAMVDALEAGGERGDGGAALEVLYATDRITSAQGARIEGGLVQEMIEAGSELLVGMVRDAQFGPLVVVGFGGIDVEVLRDTAARLAPFGPGEAREMLDELRMAPVLRGARGRPPADAPALAETVSRFSRLAAEVPELAELEVNPLIADSRRVVAVDARARRVPR